VTKAGSLKKDVLKMDKRAEKHRSGGGKGVNGMRSRQVVSGLLEERRVK